MVARMGAGFKVQPPAISRDLPLRQLMHPHLHPHLHPPLRPPLLPPLRPVDPTCGRARFRSFKVVPTCKQQRALQRLERAALQQYMRKADEEDKEGVAYQIEQAIDARVSMLQRDHRRAVEMILNAVNGLAEKRDKSK